MTQSRSLSLSYADISITTYTHREESLQSKCAAGWHQAAMCSNCATVATNCATHSSNIWTFIRMSREDKLGQTVLIRHSVSAADEDQPITVSQRLRWFSHNTGTGWNTCHYLPPAPVFPSQPAVYCPTSRHNKTRSQSNHTDTVFRSELVPAKFNGIQ